jgi:hypothetical protein
MPGISNVYYILASVNNAYYTDRNKPKKCLFFIKVILKDLFIKALSSFEYAFNKSPKRRTFKGYNR